MALSAVHRGVAFEQRSLEVLQRHLSMSLRKVGGKSDGGVDLQGWWWVPSPPPAHSAAGPSPPLPPALSTTTGPDGEPRQPLRVLGQCKAEAKKVGPNYVREMEGVLHRYHHHHHHYDASGGVLPPPVPPVVALLVSQSPFTRTTVLRAFSSPIPFFLLHLPPSPPQENAPQPPREDGQPPLPPAEDDGLGAAIWNPALAGEAGLLRGEMEVRWERSATRRGGGRPGLWWKGHRLKGWTPGSEAVMEEDDW